MATTKPRRTVKERALDAEVRGNQWLSAANEAMESGDSIEEELCDKKAQFWLDRANLLNGRGEKAPPKH